ncbi:ASCH domain-containing protein [Rubinisphaera margarita]|uniref:ASCH domain-containing protein n=1 Tax=Rubinisphaera margarita TaxID=2909586 RepID=UPI001EE9757F|nr:ASCH domain-containing protein [Rubinisphaera margarita]MCG6154979.1 ASCH domain-containing protein [Rubinisphaera margarita]
MNLELDRERIALGIRQPWAELILQGRKTIEVRSRPTNVRGPIYIYTSQKISRDPLARESIERFGLDPSKLVYGRIIGEVTIADCRRSDSDDSDASCIPTSALQNHFAWELTNPVRFEEPQLPKFLPYGVWFYPFRRKTT